ncbi:MAG: AAA family ATPase [Chloroflexi bacterium]|nr:AAA family ATPase [Chloroflexota bacterium]
MATTQARVTSGVPGLDAMLNGGFIPQSAILIRGAPGTGKTTFGLQYLLDGVDRGEPGLFISFEEFPQSLYRDAASLGWDLPAIEESGLLRIVFTSPQVLMSSLASPESNLIRTIHEFDIQRVVIDSLSHFTQFIADGHELRQVYHQVTNAFRREGVTVIYLAEEMRSDYTNQEKGRLSFIVDNIVMLRYLEIDSAIQRAILVLKMRSSAHDTAIYSYSIGADGIAIGKPIEGKSGLLSGLATRRMISTVQ